jgi:hypothetical protein
MGALIGMQFGIRVLAPVPIQRVLALVVAGLEFLLTLSILVTGYC